MRNYHFQVWIADQDIARHHIQYGPGSLSQILERSQWNGSDELVVHGRRFVRMGDYYGCAAVEIFHQGIQLLVSQILAVAV